MNRMHQEIYFLQRNENRLIGQAEYYQTQIERAYQKQKQADQKLHQVQSEMRANVERLEQDVDLLKQEIACLHEHRSCGVRPTSLTTNGISPIQVANDDASASGVADHQSFGGQSFGGQSFGGFGTTDTSVGSGSSDQTPPYHPHEDSGLSTHGALRAALSSSEGASEVSPTSNCDNEGSGMNSMVEQHNMSAVGGSISLDDLNGSNEETTINEPWFDLQRSTSMTMVRERWTPYLAAVSKKINDGTWKHRSYSDLYKLDVGWQAGHKPTQDEKDQKKRVLANARYYVDKYAKEMEQKKNNFFLGRAYELSLPLGPSAYNKNKIKAIEYYNLAIQNNSHANEAMKFMTALKN